MPGLKVTLPTSFSNSSLDTYFPDKRMNKGSLFLIDFSYPTMNTATIPAHGSTITNIARDNAKKVITTGVVGDYDPTIENTATSTGMFLEFTPKKGLHAIVSQVNDVATGNDFGINIPANIVAYIRANISRGFFVSVWDCMTRLYNGTDVPRPNFSLGVDGSNDYVAMLAQEGFYNISAYTNKRTTGKQLGNRINNYAFTAVGAGAPSSSYAASRNRWGFGSHGIFSTFGLNKMPSQILYQIHIVDLTSAGLTYAQADALDLAAYNAAFGVGGRFYGDTFTSPSTLP